MAGKRRAPANRRDHSALVLLPALSLALVAGWFGVPVFAATSLALVVTSLFSVRPELTGPKDPMGYPTPLGREQKKLLRYRFWSELRVQALVPTRAWLPGWPPAVISLIGLAAAALSIHQPLMGLLAENPTATLAALIVNAWCAYGLAAGFDAAWRATRSEFGSQPVTDVRESFVALPGPVSRAAAAAASVLAAVLIGMWLARTVVLTAAGALGLWAFLPGGLLAGGLVWFFITRRPALAHWREVDAQRELWKPRWEAMKVRAHLEDYREYGFFTVTTFETRQAGEIIRQPAKVVAEIGGSQAVAVIPHPQQDSNGEDIPGSTHPNLFRVVTWPANEAPTPAIAAASEAERIRLVLHTAVWASRWARMKKWDAHPVVVGFEQIDTLQDQPPVSVTTFDLPQSLSIQAVLDQPKLIDETVGQRPLGFVGAFAACPDIDPQTGSPTPGTQSGTRFQYIEAPDDLSLADPGLSLECVYQVLRAHLWMHAVEVGARAPEIVDLAQIGDLSGVTGAENAPQRSEDGQDEPDTIDPHPESVEAFSGAPGGFWACWRASLAVAGPTCVPPAVVRAEWLDGLAHAYGASALMRAGDLIVGGFDSDGFAFADDASFSDGRPVDEDAIMRLIDEDEWTTRWARLFDDNPGKVPSMRHEASMTRTLATGVEIEQRAFVARQNQSLTDVMKTEATLSSVLAAAPFAALDYMPDTKADRPGFRHPMGVAVRYSRRPVPSRPDVLPPQPVYTDRRQTAALWVLQAQLRQAFTAAKLAHPQVYAVEPLSTPDSPAHLWRAWARLHGGVTLAEVRKQSSIIRRHLGSEYLRVGEDGDVIVLVIGAHPDRCTLIDAEVIDEELAVMDWEQAFLDAGVRNSEGVTPTLAGFRRLEKNPEVMIVDFDLPSGLDTRRIKQAIDKLSGPTGYGFIQLQPVEDTGRARIMCSRQNPMPTKAPYDPDTILATGDDEIPFSLGLDGEPVVFDVKQNTHLMVLGGQGSGKSVGLQAIITPAVMKGYDLYVADPMKGAADFQYLRPFSRGFIDIEVEDGGLFHLAAMLKAVYAQVGPRKQLNMQHGVGNYRELPEQVRPKHMMVVIDEFTSLIMLDPEPKSSMDPEIEAERERILARNAAKKEIAVYVGKIIREARSVGVSMMLATQKITSEMMKGLAGTNDMKTNTSTLVLGKSKDTDRAAAGMINPYDVPDLGESVAKGRGLYESIEAGVQMVQIWFEPGGQRGLADLISTVREPLAADEVIDYEAYLRLPQIHEGPAVEMLPPEPVVEDLGDLDLDLGDDWLAGLEDAEEIGGEDGGDEPESADDPAEADEMEDETASDEPDWDQSEPDEEGSTSEEEGESVTSAEPEPPAPSRSAPLIDQEPAPEADRMEVGSFVPNIPTIDDDGDLFAAKEPSRPKRKSRRARAEDGGDSFSAPKKRTRASADADAFAAPQPKRTKTLPTF